MYTYRKYRRFDAVSEDLRLVLTELRDRNVVTSGKSVGVLVQLLRDRSCSCARSGDCRSSDTNSSETSWVTREELAVQVA